MHYSTASKKVISNSSVALLVSLFLILLTLFIILNSNSAVNKDKKKIALQSVQTVFKKTEEQQIIFEHLYKVQPEQYSLEIQKIIKKYGTVATTNDEDIIKANIPLDAFYFADEVNFRSEAMDDVINLTSILKSWASSENLRISVQLSETNFDIGKQRLQFWRKNVTGINPLIGLRLDGKAAIEIIIERDL